MMLARGGRMGWSRPSCGCLDRRKCSCAYSVSDGDVELGMLVAIEGQPLSNLASLSEHGFAAKGSRPDPASGSTSACGGSARMQLVVGTTWTDTEDVSPRSRVSSFGSGSVILDFDESDGSGADRPADADRGRPGAPADVGRRASGGAPGPPRRSRGTERTKGEDRPRLRSASPASPAKVGDKGLLRALGSLSTAVPASLTTFRALGRNEADSVRCEGTGGSDIRSGGGGGKSSRGTRPRRPSATDTAGHRRARSGSRERADRGRSRGRGPGRGLPESTVRTVDKVQGGDGPESTRGTARATLRTVRARLAKAAEDSRWSNARKAAVGGLAIAALLVLAYVLLKVTIWREAPQAGGASNGDLIIKGGAGLMGNPQQDSAAAAHKSADLDKRELALQQEKLRLEQQKVALDDQQKALATDRKEHDGNRDDFEKKKKQLEEDQKAHTAATEKLAREQAALKALQEEAKGHAQKSQQLQEEAASLQEKQAAHDFAAQQLQTEQNKLQQDQQQLQRDREANQAKAQEEHDKANSVMQANLSRQQELIKETEKLNAKEMQLGRAKAEMGRQQNEFNDQKTALEKTRQEHVQQVSDHDQKVEQEKQELREKQAKHAADTAQFEDQQRSAQQARQALGQAMANRVFTNNAVNMAYANAKFHSDRNNPFPQ